MPNLDDQIRSGLKKLAQPPASRGVYERVVQQAAHRGRGGRVLVIALVLGVSLGGIAMLLRTFGLDRGAPPGGSASVLPTPLQEAPRGTIAWAQGNSIFVRSLGPTADTKELATEDGTVAYLAWAPHSEALAYIVSRRSAGGGRLVTLSPERKSVLVASNSPFAPAWSPDEREIVFAQGDVPGLALVDVESGAVRPLTRPSADCRDDWPSWSPDGSRIVFVRTCGSQEGAPESSLRAIERGEEAVLDPDFSATGPISWSPDGSTLAYSAAGTMTLYSIVDGSTSTVPSQGDNFAPAWSPDGNHLVFSSVRGRDADIWVVRIDGQSEFRVTSGGIDDAYPSWRRLPEA